MKPRLELVFWRDAHGSMDDDLDHDDYIVKTVGWTSEDGKFLKIVSERLPHGEGVRAVTRVPVDNVIRRRPLELVRD